MLSGKRRQQVGLPFLTAEALALFKQGPVDSAPFSLSCKNRGPSSTSAEAWHSEATALEHRMWPL